MYSSGLPKNLKSRKNLEFDTLGRQTWNLNKNHIKPKKHVVLHLN